MTVVGIDLSTRALDLVVSRAATSDLDYVMSLMRANRESVGGLPRPAIQERLDRRSILVARINGDPVGYLMYDLRGRTLRIPQACIQYDARRRKHGEALVAALMTAHARDVDEVTLRVAADLEANLFWRDMGFTCVSSSLGGKRRGRLINSWAMWLTPRLLAIEDIAAVPVAQRRQDLMYDDTDYMTGVPEGFSDAGQLPRLAWSNRRKV